jgi:hypothetical protein
MYGTAYTISVFGAPTMARPSRAEVFDPNEVAIAHVFNRTVRRCFLMKALPGSGLVFGVQVE